MDNGQGMMGSVFFYFGSWLYYDEFFLSIFGLHSCMALHLGVVSHCFFCPVAWFCIVFLLCGVVLHCFFCLLVWFRIVFFLHRSVVLNCFFALCCGFASLFQIRRLGCYGAVPPTFLAKTEYFFLQSCVFAEIEL